MTNRNRIPSRYVTFFRLQRGTVGIVRGDTQPERWICRVCSLAVKPNAAGAQSHIAKHLRVKP